MIGNAVVNPNRRILVQAIMPHYTDASKGETKGLHYRAMQGRLASILESTTLEYETYALDSEETPGRIVVRHLSLFHPSFNLQEIDHFYNAYCRRGERKRLFHVDRRFVDFSEIIRPSQIRKYPTCGNPGCQFDLTEVSREEIICPGCGLPIRSRCGNSGCTEDYLHERKGMAGPKPRISCPECGKVARTYWWWCPDHNVHISTNSNFCLKCEMEYDQGARRFEDIRRREGVEPTINCPGCVHDGREEPFRIGFLDVYDQVPENMVGRALSVYHGDTNHGTCPECGATLLPLCPYTKEDDPPHFVQRARTKGMDLVPDKCVQQKKEKAPTQIRGQGFFYCTSDQEHVKECIRECSFCGMPLKDEATYCPRCKRSAPDYEPEDREIVQLMAEERMIYTGMPLDLQERRCCEDPKGPRDDGPTDGGGPAGDPPRTPLEEDISFEPAMDKGGKEEDPALDPEKGDGDTAAFVEQANQEGLDPEHIRDAVRAA